MAAPHPPIFAEKVPDPPPDLLKTSARDLKVFSAFIRLFAIILVLSLPWWLTIDASQVRYGVDPKALGVGIVSILAVAIGLLLLTHIELLLPSLRAINPIVLSKGYLTIPTTFVEHGLLRRPRQIPLTSIRHIKVVRRKDRAHDRQLTELSVAVDGGKEYPCGPKLASQVEALTDALARLCPGLLILREPPKQ